MRILSTILLLLACPRAPLTLQYRDKLREQNALSEEIVNAITSNQIGEPIDEDELDAELEEIQQNQLDEQMLKTGTVPVSDQIQHVPAAPQDSKLLRCSKQHYQHLLTRSNSQGQDPSRGRGGRRGGRVAEATGRDGHVSSSNLGRCCTCQSMWYDADMAMGRVDVATEGSDPQQMDGERAAGEDGDLLAWVPEVLLQEPFSVTGVGVWGFCIIDGNGKGGAYQRSYISSDSYDRSFLLLIVLDSSKHERQRDFPSPSVRNTQDHPII